VTDRVGASGLSSMNDNQQCSRLGSTGKLCGRWVIQSLRFGRIGQPSDISTVAVFLASSDSVWITGESLWVWGWAGVGPCRGPPMPTVAVRPC
jgi:NAD(P)-dependent dehydrogenase (short-subunit alcohol dehydrogenase family)